MADRLWQPVIPQWPPHSHPTSPPGNSFVRHNARHLTRVYPLGLRMNSTNYSPQEMWNSGCQLGEWGQQKRGWAGATFGGVALGAMEAPVVMGQHSFPEVRNMSLSHNNY